MKSLNELREVLGELQSQVSECMNFLERLAPLEEVFGGVKRKYNKRTNGDGGMFVSEAGLVSEAGGGRNERMREQVKQHFRTQRNIAQRNVDGVAAKPNPNNITIAEAATMLNLSEAGVRDKIRRGHLHATREVRDTKGPRGGISYLRALYVVDKREAAALARAMAAGVGLDARGRARRRQNHHVLRPSVTEQPVVTEQATQKPLSRIARQRQQSAEYLAQFDHETPRTFPSRLTGALVRRGYLRKKGDGYVRSTKPFSVAYTKGTKAAPKTNGKTNGAYRSANAKAKRQATAEILAKFDSEEPRPTSVVEKSNSLGVLVTTGYLRKKDGGYVRTGKEFHP